MKPVDICFDGRKREVILSFFSNLHHRAKLKRKTTNAEGIDVPRSGPELIKILKFVDKVYMARSLQVPLAMIVVTKTALSSLVEAVMYTMPETPKEILMQLRTKCIEDYVADGVRVELLNT